MTPSPTPTTSRPRIPRKDNMVTPCDPYLAQPKRGDKGVWSIIFNEAKNPISVLAGTAVRPYTRAARVANNFGLQRARKNLYKPAG